MNKYSARVLWERMDLSRGEGGSRFLSLMTKVLGVLIAVLGSLVIYYSYKTPLSLIDPKMIAPLGVFLIAIGGFMLLARVR